MEARATALMILTRTMLRKNQEAGHAIEIWSWRPGLQKVLCLIWGSGKKIGGFRKLAISWKSGSGGSWPDHANLNLEAMALNLMFVTEEIIRK